jgi:hypothetical protein
MKNIIFTSIFLGFTTAACGGGQSSGAGGGSAASGSAGTGAGGGSAAQPAVCKSYINCLSLAAPELVGDALDVYGTDGSCWKKDAESAAICQQACASGLEKQHGIHPSEPACDPPLCQQSTDCKDPTKPVCQNGACISQGCAATSAKFNEWYTKLCACPDQGCDPANPVGLPKTFRDGAIDHGCIAELDAIMTCAIPMLDCSGPLVSAMACDQAGTLEKCENNNPSLGCSTP